MPGKAFRFDELHVSKSTWERIRCGMLSRSRGSSRRCVRAFPTGLKSRRCTAYCHSSRADLIVDLEAGRPHAREFFANLDVRGMRRIGLERGS